MTEPGWDDAPGAVTLLYRLLLDREPDPDGLQHHVEALEANRMSPQQLARAFATSDEFTGRQSAANQRVRVDSNGCIFILPSGAAAAAELASPEGYEPWVLPYFLDLCRPGMTVLDIGASWGAFALPAARRVTSTGKVFALEVSAANCRVLTRSARASGLGNISLLPFGVSDHVGAELLRRQDFTNNNSIKTGLSVDDGDLEDFDVVPVLPIDRFSADLGAVQIFKMDIEGMEYRATIGGANFLGEQRPIVFTEYSPAFQKVGSGVEGAALLGFFIDLGYQIEILHRGRPREMVATGDGASAISRVDSAWRRHVKEDQGTHLDLCLHPLPR